MIWKHIIQPALYRAMIGSHHVGCGRMISQSYVYMFSMMRVCFAVSVSSVGQGSICNGINERLLYWQTTYNI